MLHSINGKLKEKNPTNVIIETCGIGYDIRIPLSTYERLPDKDGNCSLFLHLYISMNQDEVRLYGFSSIAERAVFAKLISISGIGPKIALSILSSMNLNMLIKAVSREEDGLLSKVPGIGKKTAQRLIIELKDHVAEFMQLLDTKERVSMDNTYIEVEKALVALGYNAKEIQKTMHKLTDAEKQLPVEQQIKIVIKLLYQK